MHAFARLRLPDGSSVDVSHGDLLGRVRSAQVVLEDPRVSEAHAMVSLRRGELVLLSLRRMLFVRGRSLSEVPLTAGMGVDLAEGVTLYVEEVQHPERVLAVEAEGMGRQLLPSIASIKSGPPPSLAARFDATAAVHVWWDGDGWRARNARGGTRSVADGDTFEVPGLALRFVLVASQASATTQGGPSVATPVRIVAWFDTVELHRAGCEPLTLGGVNARILSELAAIEGPVQWSVLAREVWREPVETLELRHRWDVSLARLRQRLKEAGVRPDLLRSTGAGFVQLLRYPGDVCEDRR